MKYLGLDWGMKRVGVAISEGELAEPYGVLEIKGLLDGLKKVQDLIKKEEVDKVIIGKPEGDMGEKVKNVAKLLTDAGFNVSLTDETLSTKTALKEMIDLGIGQKGRSEDNAFAAAIILQRFLDEEET